MKELFEIQPEWCRAPLPEKEIVHSDWVTKEHPENIVKWERIIFFDPTEIYERIHESINPYSRIASTPVGAMFPDIKGFCACGCGVKLTGARRRWATNDCSNFAWNIRNIICNAHQIPGKYIGKYFGDRCIKCNELVVELDHIVGVKHGGGGCWLSNYQYLCKTCHRKKTNKDFGWNQKPPQLTLFQ